MFDNFKEANNLKVFRGTFVLPGTSNDKEIDKGSDTTSEAEMDTVRGELVAEELVAADGDANGEQDVTAVVLDEKSSFFWDNCVFHVRVESCRNDSQTLFDMQR